jgi:hypothetical protein
MPLSIRGWVHRRHGVNDGRSDSCERKDDQLLLLTLYSTALTSLRDKAPRLGSSLVHSQPVLLELHVHHAG